VLVWAYWSSNHCVVGRAGGGEGNRRNPRSRECFSLWGFRTSIHARHGCVLKSHVLILTSNAIVLNEKWPTANAGLLLPRLPRADPVAKAPETGGGGGRGGGSAGYAR